MSRPTGTEMRVAAPVIKSVPMMAWRAPPPSPTTLRIDSVKKSRSKRGSPLTTTVKMREISGSRATMNAVATREVTRRLRACLEPSTRAATTYKTMSNNTVPSRMAATMLKSPPPDACTKTNTTDMIAQLAKRMIHGAQRGRRPARSRLISLGCGAGASVDVVVVTSWLQRTPCGD